MSASDRLAFLIEIGCEEIPARFLAAAERDLGQRLESAAREARLLDSDTPVKTASTPRRLIAYLPALLPRQPDRVNAIVGPSVKAAFDPKGQPTRAAEAFAAKHHVPVSELRRIRQAKGEYVAADVREPGRPASEVLVDVLPHVIGGLSFPKSMYWTSKAGPLFVRPIRWILALLADEGSVRVVPFEFAGVKSGSYTFGHRLTDSQPIEVGDLNHDLKLRNHWVMVHQNDRREGVQNGIKALIEGTGLAVPKDEFIENWVVNSTEWPVPIMGKFDARFLALPREALVTVMRDHQKYFAVEDNLGCLQPRFITVLNVPGDAKGLIRQGHERVLAARFADAEFFWNADQKIRLAERTSMLERVMYHAKLGTYGDKVQRMRALAESICDELQRRQALSSEERQYALRAVELCKCDLTTQMVQEFTELQGVMGGLYANAQEESQQVADAIYDHYRPVSTEDACPRSMAGAVVSLADKLDSILAGFSVGLAPTGSSDPFALRRAGNGVVKLGIEMLPSTFSFSSVFDGFLSAPLPGLAPMLDVPAHGAVVQPGTAPKTGLKPGAKAAAAPGIRDLRDRVEDFLAERMEFYFREVAGLRYDTARAVLRSMRVLGQPGAAGQFLRRSGPADALSRAKALESVRDKEDFLALAAAAKRTRNIRKSASEDEIGDNRAPDPARFTEDAERNLYEVYRKLCERIGALSAEGNYEEAFRAMGTIRPQVDRFFDNVMVMVEDSEVRRNRLRLLMRLNDDVFTSLADLAEITVESRAGAAPGA